jgi:uncharacterized cupin superfamily protein
VGVIRDPMQVPPRRGTVYPAEHAGGFEGRLKRALTEQLGLTQFGVNVTTLEPGAMSAHRHWHMQEDEFIYVLSGTITLVTNEGEQVLEPNMTAGFPRGDANGHHLINKTDRPATYLEIGTRSPDEDVDYPDLDMKGEKRDGRYRFMRRSGEPYP